MDFKELVKHYGGAKKAAQALQVKRQTVYRWQTGIPYLRQLHIEKVSGGKLKANGASQ